jgi:hypothetical protein
MIQRGRIAFDYLPSAFVAGWIAGVGAALVGGAAINIWDRLTSDVSDMGFVLFGAAAAMILVPIGFFVSLPLILLLQAVGLLNGLSVLIVGAFVAAPIAIIFLWFTSYSVLAVFVGVCTGAAAWHAGAKFSNDAA